MNDLKGNEIHVGDTVRAAGWGYGILLAHTQGTGEVVGFGTKRVRVLWSGFAYAAGEHSTARPEMIRVVNSTNGKA